MGEYDKEYYIQLYIIDDVGFRWIDAHVRGEEDIFLAMKSAVESVQEKYGDDCDVRIREARLQDSVEHLFIGE